MFTLTEMQEAKNCSRRVAFVVVRLQRGIESIQSMVLYLPLTQGEFYEISQISMELGLTIQP